MPVAPLRPLHFAGLAVAAGLAAVVGCSSSSASEPAVTHPTMIRVEPANFLGEVRCDPNGLGLKRYVATIVDRNLGEGGAPSDAASDDAPLAGASGFEAPSSLPTPCNTGTGFGLVVPGRHYEVLIDGYDTDELAPRALGSREMVPTDHATDPVHTEVLTPRWSAKCARALAVDSTIVLADQCRPFQLDEAGALGELRVALGDLLGALRCGDEPGDVDHFDVTLTLADGGTLRSSVSCSEPEAVFSGLTARQRTSLYVEAFARGGTEPLAGATCSALIEPGASVEADCAALSELGTLRVDLVEALALLGAQCSASEIATVTVQVPGEMPRSFPPPDCLVPFTHGFPAGEPDVSISVTFVNDPVERGSVTCHGEVAPGQFATAICELNSQAL